MVRLLITTETAETTKLSTPEIPFRATATALGISPNEDPTRPGPIKLELSIRYGEYKRLKSPLRWHSGSLVLHSSLLHLTYDFQSPFGTASYASEIGTGYVACRRAHTTWRRSGRSRQFSQVNTQT